MGFWRYRPRGTVHLGHWLASEQERSLQEQIVRLQSLLAAARREIARLRKGGKAKDGRRRAPDETQAAGRYPIAREGTGYQGRDGTIYYPERAARRAQPKMVPQHASAGYNPRRMKPENLEDRLIRAARAVPPDKRDAAIRCLEQLAAGEVGAGVGARLMRELSPEQLAALLEESPLGHAVTRYERQLPAAELPAGGFFQSKTQADAGASLGQALRDLQNVQARFGLPITENEKVRKAEAKAATYRRSHDPATGAFIVPRPRGRPRRNARQEVAPTFA